MIIAALVIARMLSGRSTSRRWSVYAPGGGLAPFRHVWYRYRPRAGVHLYVARRESAWAGIILFPHTAKPLRDRREPRPAVLWPGVAVASLLRENAG